MSPSAGRVVSQKVNFWGQGNKQGSPRLPLGEERTNILLLACCYQEGCFCAPGHVLFSLSSQAVTAVSPERAIFAGYSALRFLRLSTSLMVAVACGLRRRLRLWKPATRTRATDYTCRFQRHRQELRTRKFRAFPPLVLRCSSGRPRASANPARQYPAWPIPSPGSSCM